MRGKSSPFGKHDFESYSPREYELLLKIHDREGEGVWRSDYENVQNLLDHLARFSKSESSRRKYLNLVKNFCLLSEYTPDELVDLPEYKAEKLVQKFVDEKAKNDCIKRYHTHSGKTLPQQEPSQQPNPHQPPPQPKPPNSPKNQKKVTELENSKP